jgi:hypothetical protein
MPLQNMPSSLLFFQRNTSAATGPSLSHTPAVQSALSPDGSSFFGMRSPSGSDFGQQQQPLPSAFTSTTPGLGGFMSFVARSKEDQAVIDTIWKQVMDPVMDYCTVRLHLLLLSVIF